jgi:hypothetical protein
LAVSGPAGRQWGVVARAQLLSLGVSTAVVDAWVQRGRLHRVHQGVYARGHTVLLHRSRSLDAQDTTRHEGIPITTVHRTLLDRTPRGSRPGRAGAKRAGLVSQDDT